MNQVSFLKNFVKDRSIGALTPTTHSAIKKVCANIDFSRDISIVEYGPGTGVCTLYALGRMTPASSYIGIETNSVFVGELQKVKDPRFTIVHGSAENSLETLRSLGVKSADYVISSIPFSFLSDKTRASIVGATHEALRPGGTFIVYQYSPLMKKYLEAVFGHVRLRFTPLHIPSIFIMEAQKT